MNTVCNKMSSEMDGPTNEGIANHLLDIADSIKAPSISLTYRRAAVSVIRETSDVFQMTDTKELKYVGDGISNKIIEFVKRWREYDPPTRPSLNINTGIVNHLLTLASESEKQGNDKVGLAYRVASMSISRYREVIKNGNQARKLCGVGPHICTIIDKFLRTDTVDVRVIDFLIDVAVGIEVSKSKAASMKYINAVIDLEHSSQPVPESILPLVRDFENNTLNDDILSVIIRGRESCIRDKRSATDDTYIYRSGGPIAYTITDSLRSVPMLSKHTVDLIDQHVGYLELLENPDVCKQDKALLYWCKDIMTPITDKDLGDAQRIFSSCTVTKEHEYIRVTGTSYDVLEDSISVYVRCVVNSSPSETIVIFQTSPRSIAHLVAICA